MSSFTKKDQDKAIFTVKKDTHGNVVVSRASGANGGEIRGSILRTNKGTPYLVSGYGLSILSGSNVGAPGPGQITLSLDLESIKSDIEKIVVDSGISGMTGPKGPPGATGATGPPGAAGEQGTSGAQGQDGANGTSITDIIDNGDATMTVTWDTGTTDVDVPGATVALDPTITLSPGTPASVANSGTPSAAVFEFSIPEGQIGTSVTSTVLNGNDLEITTTDYTGATNTVNVGTVVGSDGTAATIAVGSVATGAPGSAVTIVNSGDATNAVFDFSIPEGDQGAPGVGGESGDVYSFYVPIVSTSFTESYTGYSATGGAGTTHNFEIARTLFSPDDFNIASASLDLTWEIMFDVGIDTDIVDEEWEFHFKLQYWDGASWSETLSDVYPVSPSPAIEAGLEIWQDGLTFDPVGSGTTQIKLVCEATAIDTGDPIIAETLNVVVHMARIKVQYTVP